MVALVLCNLYSIRTGVKLLGSAVTENFRCEIGSNRAL